MTIRKMFAAAVAMAAMAATAERVEMRLDGNGWTLDGLPVLVPHCWNKADGADGDPGEAAASKTFASSVPATSYARRRGVYSRDLPDTKEGRRYFVRCEGASQAATVRVNGVEIGSHKGAFTAFCFEATEAIKPSGNRLEIEVSNEFDLDIPPISGDFTLAGGLYRSVWLIETDPVCIDPTIDGGPGVRVFPSLDGMVRVEVDVSGADDAVVDWEPKWVANLKLWSPEEPNVYAVTVTVKKAEWSDTVVQPFGFRTAEMREDGFYLNGVKRKVRGVNRHQDLEGKGWEVSAAEEERDVDLIKAMGADGLRLAHYPQSANMFNLCDRKGLMVWSESPVVDAVGGEAFRDNARRMLRETIAQHRNHPSVCWWGVWNELFNCPQALQGDEADWAAFSAELVRLCQTRDPSRPVVAASCKLDRKTLNATVSNLCYNKYPLWYEDETMREAVDAFVATNGLAVTALSEYGAGGSVFLHQNPVKKPVPIISRFHPEEYQTFVHMADLRDIQADDRLWGSFVWAMFDFAADARREGDRYGVNDKGLVTRDRTTPKDAYYLYKANWSKEPMLHLCGKRMGLTANDLVQVVAFSNVGDVRLTVNGETVGVKTPDEICSVTFDGVQLRSGENRIRVAVSTSGCDRVEEAIVRVAKPSR